MKLHARKVRIIIDGKKHTVPFEVYNLINNQREANGYYMHLLSLWYYKCYLNNLEKDKLKKFIEEFAACLKDDIFDLNQRITQFKTIDKVS